MRKKYPQLGDWVYHCCKEDLHKITSKAELDDLTEDIKNHDAPYFAFFRTKRKALKSLK